MSNGAGRGAVWKSKVGPEIAQNLREVGFSAAVKAANPGCLLLGALKVIPIALKDPTHALEVFALVNERFEFKPERVEIFYVVAGDALIDQFPSQRVPEEYFFGLH